LQKRLLQKRTHFRENFLGNENFRKNFRENVRENENFRENFRENENFCETKFREISRKFAHLRIIFAFRAKWKKPFSFQPYPPPQLSLHRRAALRTNSNGTPSAHKGKQRGAV
jgi:hypothetical protein